MNRKCAPIEPKANITWNHFSVPEGWYHPVWAMLFLMKEHKSAICSRKPVLIHMLSDLGKHPFLKLLSKIELNVQILPSGSPGLPDTLSNMLG